MKRVVLMLVFIFLLIGCREVRQEFSETLYRDAVVAEVVYVPAHMNIAIGFDSDFNPTINSVSVPDEFRTVFVYQNGQFALTTKDIYEKFNDYKGKTVVVAYKEIYWTTYESKNSERWVVKREFAGEQFLNATLK